MEASQELESLLGAATAAPAAANYLLVIAEQQQQPGGSNADPQQVRSGSSSSSGVLGVLAVDVGSGDIAYGLCSCSSSRSSSGSNGSSNGSGITPLEAVLLSVAPADIVIVEPVSTTINRLLSSYMAGSSRRCRIDCLQQQQSGGSSSSSGGEGYLDSANLKQLQEFYGGSTSDGVPESKTPAANAAAAGAGSSDDLQFILSLPHMVLLALCGALQYLRAFGLTSVLQCTSGFRALGVGRHMQLDGNALRQLQILSTGKQMKHTAIRQQVVMHSVSAHVTITPMSLQQACVLHVHILSVVSSQVLMIHLLPATAVSKALCCTC